MPDDLLVLPFPFEVLPILIHFPPPFFYLFFFLRGRLIDVPVYISGFFNGSALVEDGDLCGADKRLSGC